MTSPVSTWRAAEARKLLISAVSVPSLSGDERPLAELLCDWASVRGLNAWMDEVGNVHARVGPPIPGVMLVSHLDTVGGELPFRVTDDAVFGRGSVDAKGSLVGMLVAVESLCDSRLPLHWTGVVEEETIDSRGAEHLARSVAEPAALIVGEPSGADRVTIGYKGKVDYRYHCEVPDAHTATPQDKASEVGMRFLSAVGQRYGSAGNASFGTVGLTIRAGRLEPEASTFILSFRVPPHLDVRTLDAELEQLCGAAGEVVRLNCFDAVTVPRTDPVVMGLSAAIAATGARPRHVLKTGTSDMNTLAKTWDVPMAAYGPGDSRLDHSATEHLEFGEFHRAIDVLVDTLPNLARRTATAGSA